MTPFQCTLSKTISQLLNYDEFRSPSSMIRQLRNLPTETWCYIASLAPSSPDVIYLPVKERNCISLKCTCRSEEREFMFIPKQLANMRLAISSFMREKTTANMWTDSISFLFFSVMFSVSLVRCYAISRLLRTFTFKLLQFQQISWISRLA